MPVHLPEPFTLTGSYTTSRFDWSAAAVNDWLMGGIQPIGTTQNVIVSGTISSSQVAIPQQPMTIRMNLWLVNGNPPTDGQPVEVVIRDFSRN
jgi:hypothetical protein